MKNTLGKVPKPLKPKPFQKVLNTIPMPMRINNVPFKPIAEPRGGGKRQPDQSPTRKPVPPTLQSIERSPGQMALPVRIPEKNNIAIQQLTLADHQRFERVILGDVDFDTECLLKALKEEGKIQAYRL